MKSITPGEWTREGGLIVDEAGNVIAGRYARLHKEKGEGYGTISPTEADANCQAMSAVPSMLATLGALGAWLIAPDLSADTLKGMRSLITATMNKALGKEKT